MAIAVALYSAYPDQQLDYPLPSFLKLLQHITFYKLMQCAIHWDVLVLPVKAYDNSNISQASEGVMCSILPAEDAQPGKRLVNHSLDQPLCTGRPDMSAVAWSDAAAASERLTASLGVTQLTYVSHQTILGE